MHSSSLYSKGGPWKRYPLPINSYEFTGEKISIGSPYGGMTYIVAKTPLEKPVSVELSFSNIMQYPIFSSLKNHLWEETKQLNIPWGEIHTKMVIFVLPKEDLEKLTTINEIANQIDTFINFIYDFTSNPHPHPFRIVFDVEVPSGSPVCGYPIVLLLELLEDLFNSASPNPTLFQLVLFFSVLSLPEDAFPEDAEASLAHICASLAFKQIWPEDKPQNHSDLSLLPYFNDLWKIQNEHGVSVLKTAIGKITQDSNSRNKGKNDTWGIFVRQVASITKLNLNHLIPNGASKASASPSQVISISPASNLKSYLLTEIDTLDGK